MLKRIRELKKMNSGELLTFVGENRKFLEKILLIFVIGICIIIYISGNKEEDIVLENNGELTVSKGLSGMGEISGKEASENSTDSSFNRIYIDVGGAVNKPGVVVLEEGARVFQAIEAAGGLTKAGDTSTVNLAQQMEDGDKLWIPTGEEVARDFEESGNSVGLSEAGGLSSKKGKININTADSTQLQEINGIGAVTASKIIAYRQEHGKFRKVEELKAVNGIGEKTFEKLKEEVCI